MVLDVVMVAGCEVREVVQEAVLRTEPAVEAFVVDDLLILDAVAPRLPGNERVQLLVVDVAIGERFGAVALDDLALRR
jgi:hypothetical protein